MVLPCLSDLLMKVQESIAHFSKEVNIVRTQCFHYMEEIKNTNNHLLELCIKDPAVRVFIKQQIQQVSGWLSKNRDENPRMRKIFNSKAHQKCAHVQILVATNLKTAVGIKFV